MKAGYLACVAAAALGVSAGNHHAHHHHEAFHAARDAAPVLAANTTCGCGSYTVWVTTYGEATLSMAPPPPPASSTLPVPAPAATTVNVVVVPTPAVTTFSTPGTYTIPAVTVTLTSTTTVCAATSTNAQPGTYTLGGVTTVVTTATTVVCPLATTTVNNGVVTSHIITTTYVCPSAGTYTIGPISTTVVDQTIIVYPTPASYPPGTYTQPQVVTTITETDYIVFCPFTSVAAPALAPPAATSAPPPSPPVSSAPSGPTLGSSGNQWAITYTPYTTTGTCKAASDVLTDITTIKSKGFSVVRIYATDCGGLDSVGAACESLGLKMIIGVFINGQGIGAAQQQVTDIITWNKWSLVELIVIGNEAISSGSASAEALVAFISSSKSAFQGAGYTGKCTTTEPLDTLQQYASLICPVVDVTGANLHPFFNSDVTAANAGSFVAQELAIVNSLCPGKSGINLETGWPSGGNCNGAACPSPSNQQQAVDSILASVGGSSVLFSFVNDPWKDPGQFDCEQYWGAIHLFN